MMRILIVTTMKIAMEKKIVYQKNNLIKDMRSMTKTLMKIRMKNMTLNVKITTITKMSKRIVKIRIKNIRQRRVSLS